MLLIVPFALLVLSIALGLILARTALSLIFAILGAQPHPLFIRWHVVAFAAMLFWTWYFAPAIVALQ